MHLLRTSVLHITSSAILTMTPTTHTGLHRRKMLNRTGDPLRNYRLSLPVLSLKPRILIWGYVQNNLVLVFLLIIDKARETPLGEAGFEVIHSGFNRRAPFFVIIPKFTGNFLPPFLRYVGIER